MKMEIFEQISDGFSHRKPAQIARYCQLPMQFVGDVQTVAISSRSELMNYLRVTMKQMDVEDVRSLQFVCSQTTSVGAALSLCRVAVHLSIGDGASGDPFTETWLIRHSPDGDKIVGVFGLRLMEPSAYFSRSDTIADGDTETPQVA